MREFRFALKTTVPIFFTYLFIGIAFGIMMHDAGYHPVLSVLSALLIYAGSMQIVMVPLLVSGAPIISLAVTALFLNGRHLFYGIGFVEKFRRMGTRFPYMIFSLTDETYSLLCSAEYEDGMYEDSAAFWIAALDHCYWIFGCFIGSIAGSFLPFDLSGIDFSATALFLVIVVNQWREYKNKLPFLTAAVCSFGFLMLLGPDYFLIPTLTMTMIALLMMRGKIEEREGHAA